MHRTKTRSTTVIHPLKCCCFTQSPSAQQILFGGLTAVSPLGPPTSGEATVAGWPTRGSVRDRTRNLTPGELVWLPLRHHGRVVLCCFKPIFYAFTTKGATEPLSTKAAKKALGALNRTLLLVS